MPSGKKRKRHKVATHKRKKTQKSESSQEKIVWVKALKKFTKSSLKWQFSKGLILPQEKS
jgi:hypothetical protein